MIMVTDDKSAIKGEIIKLKKEYKLIKRSYDKADNVEEREKYFETMTELYLALFNIATCEDCCHCKLLSYGIHCKLANYTYTFNSICGIHEFEPIGINHKPFQIF